jgi:hypothetical protein
VLLKVLSLYCEADTLCITQHDFYNSNASPLRRRPKRVIYRDLLAVKAALQKRAAEYRYGMSQTHRVDQCGEL